MYRIMVSVLQVVIVDEAAQAVELTCLIPLRHKCTRLVLIGDPMQLPATVLSQHAREREYDRSLFERLTRAGK
jgi:senataxin